MTRKLSKKKRKKRKGGKVRKIKKIKAKAVEKEKSLPILTKKIKIRVVGIGGGGGSIVSEIAPRLKRIKFLAANTDLQALKKLSRETEKLQFGQILTQGLGTGMKPDLGEKVAQTEADKVKKIFRGQDFSILVSCLGGGTGSGASPIFSKVARDLKNYTLGIFTLPFSFEGQKRMEIAEAALEKIKPNLNAFVICPNERIFQIIDPKTPIKEAFSAINKILTESLKGLIEMLFLPGVINIDFADLRTILAGTGKLAFLNTVFCQGENRAEEAAKQILESPLYEYGISGAERILFNISGSKNLTMVEVEKISKTISDFNKKAKIIFGISENESLKDAIKITLLAISCGERPKITHHHRRKKIRIVKKVRKTRKRKIMKKEAKIKPRELPSSVPLEKSSEPVKEEKIEIKTRRNALDVKKDLERVEEELSAKESQWEIPAFLRKKIQKE
jgi:cell division protein FtsZ